MQNWPPLQPSPTATQPSEHAPTARLHASTNLQIQREPVKSSSRPSSFHPKPQTTSSSLANWQRLQETPQPPRPRTAVCSRLIQTTHKQPLPSSISSSINRKPTRPSLSLPPHWQNTP